VPRRRRRPFRARVSLAPPGGNARNVPVLVVRLRIDLLGLAVGERGQPGRPLRGRRALLVRHAHARRDRARRPAARPASLPHTHSITPQSHSHTHTHTHTQIQTHTHAQKHTHKHIQIHTHTHTHTHEHTQTSVSAF